MGQLELTQEEYDLILKRRELQEKRKKRGAIKIEKKPQNAPQKAQAGHCDPCKVHRGRVTNPDHPMHWFEKEIFAKIGNMDHQAEHAKIAQLLKMPVQTRSRDRVYHQLCHLDVLWTEGRLPLKYKHKYEAYKKEHRIGDDNVHPDHKKEGETYPITQNKRPWNPEDYQDYNNREEFNPHTVYEYAKGA